MTVSPDAARVIRDLVRETMQDVTVTDIEISEDTDQDDDQILRVLIIYDDVKPGTVGRKAVGLTRGLRRKLAELSEERFPLVEFVSVADYTDA